MANIYTAALMEHNAHPDYKYDMEGATDEHEGVNPSCGDEMVLKLRIEDGVIEEAAFTGHGCAVSQASADMMADLVTGETVEEARRLCGLFMKMVKGETLTDEEKRRPRRGGPAGKHQPHARACEMRRAGLAHPVRDHRRIGVFSSTAAIPYSTSRELFGCQQHFADKWLYSRLS